MKVNFENFQIQKEMLQTVRAEKVDENMASFVQFPYSIQFHVVPSSPLVNFYLQNTSILGESYHELTKNPYYVLSADGS